MISMDAQIYRKVNDRWLLTSSPSAEQENDILTHGRGYDLAEFKMTLSFATSLPPSLYLRY